MDPNETLRRIRDLAEKINAKPAVHYLAAYAEELAEHVEALDGWLSKGGFLPRGWVNR